MLSYLIVFIFIVAFIGIDHRERRGPSWGEVALPVFTSTLFFGTFLALVFTNVTGIERYIVKEIDLIKRESSEGEFFLTKEYSDGKLVILYYYEQNDGGFNIGSVSVEKLHGIYEDASETATMRHSALRLRKDANSILKAFAFHPLGGHEFVFHIPPGSIAKGDSSLDVR